MSTTRRTARVAAVLVSLTITAAACGGDDGDTSAGGTAGSVEISGSSTVEPISIRVAELLEDVNPDIVVNVDGPGTGDGFKLFCAGDTDISDASRAIKDSEAEECAANGVDYVELLVAQDGITVLANPANPLECVNFADLYALFGPESDVDNWNDAEVLAGQLGSSTDLPDLDLDLTAPGAESGTYGSFIEIVLEGIYDERVDAGSTTEVEADPIRNYPGQADDNIIIQAIEGSDGALGYVGFAFAANAGDSVKELSVSEETGGECVAPTAETIADNSYPISRPLYIYVNTARAAENPAVADYVDFYLGDGYAAVEEVGYVFLSDDAKAQADAVWAGR